MMLKKDFLTFDAYDSASILLCEKAENQTKKKSGRKVDRQHPRRLRSSHIKNMRLSHH